MRPPRYVASRGFYRKGFPRGSPEGHLEGLPGGLLGCHPRKVPRGFPGSLLGCPSGCTSEGVPDCLADASPHAFPDVSPDAFSEALFQKAFPEPFRGCTLGVIFDFCKGRKSVILGVWAAPGASGAISLGRGASPPPFWGVSGAPGAPPDPQNSQFPTLKNLRNFIGPQSAATYTRSTESREWALNYFCPSGGPRGIPGACFGHSLGILWVCRAASRSGLPKECPKNAP